MAVSDQAEGGSPSDREGDTPEDPALFATASAEPPDDVDLDSALLELAAAPSVLPRSRRVLRPEADTIIADRYRIERPLGEGGMGIVFLARDVELDRRVALKLQSKPVRGDDVERLRREAKAMARLSHPNVVVVHEVGTHEGHMFIAMEYVEGGTAREWMDAKPRWRDVIDVLIGAGRGLAAAHEVGIVHRDFKPENVMLGVDGRPRVADFGLARDGPSTGASASMDPIADGRLTMTGAVLGTPAYMSPEQFAGTTVGPETDQFSFCVMAYEALFGRRPFRGRTTAELAAAVADGEIRSPPARSGVPPALTRAVLKGLQVEPAQRHAGMAALVETIEGIMRARRRRVWIGIALGAAVIASALGYRGALALQPGPCEDVAEALGQAWDDGRRDEVASVVDASVVEAIDAWADAWIEERRVVCEETRVQGERSELELGLRMACLDRHAARLDGFTAGMAEAPKDVGVEAVGKMLPALEECRDVTTLEKLANRFDRRSERDTAEQDRAHLEALRLLTQAQMRWLTYSDGAEELVSRAEALSEEHELHDVEFGALMLRADLRAREGDGAAADELRARAIEIGAAEGTEASVADAIRLRADAALESGDLSAARTHLQYFDVFARPIVSDDVRKVVELKVAVTRGRLALAEGKPREAVEWYEKALAAPELADPYHALLGLGEAYLRASRPSDAAAQWEKAIAARRAKGIENDLELAAALTNLANAHTDLKAHDKAVADLQEAHAIASRASGDQRNVIGIVLGNWGIAERHRGDLQRARELQEESLRVRTELFGDAHPFLAYATDELGELARLQRNYDEAARWLEKSVALRRTAYGNDHKSVAGSLLRLGNLYLDRGAHEDARDALTESLRILDAQPEKDPEARADVEAVLARIP